MSTEKRNYTVDFKQKAVELSYARGSVVEICRELDIPTSVLGRWRRESNFIDMETLFRQIGKMYSVSKK